MQNDNVLKTRYKCLVIMALVAINFFICFIVFCNESRIKKYDLSKYSNYTKTTVWEEPLVMMGVIDSVVCSDTALEIRGWVVKSNDMIRMYKCQVCLVDKQRNELYILPTQMEKRPDVSNAYGMQQDEYNNSGFYSRSLLDEFSDKPVEEYEIAILYENDNNKIICYMGRGIEKGQKDEKSN